MLNENDPHEWGWILSNLDLAYVFEQIFKCLKCQMKWYIIIDVI